MPKRLYYGWKTEIRLNFLIDQSERSISESVPEVCFNKFPPIFFFRFKFSLFPIFLFFYFEILSKFDSESDLTNLRGHVTRKWKKENGVD